MSGVLEFANGRMGTFDCGFNAPMRQWLEITGTAGIIRVHEMWVPNAVADFDFDRDGKKRETIVVEGRDQIVCMLEDFAAAVRSGRDPEPGPDEAVKTLRVLDALAKSRAKGAGECMIPLSHDAGHSRTAPSSRAPNGVRVADYPSAM